MCVLYPCMYMYTYVYYIFIYMYKYDKYHGVNWVLLATCKASTEGVPEHEAERLWQKSLLGR